MKPDKNFGCGGKDMSDAPIRIILLRDADKYALNEALQDARQKSTIIELERECENWFDYLGKPQSFLRMSIKSFSKNNLKKRGCFNE
jgi:hypothetical protein